VENEQELLSSANRPDLDEFLSALGGFLEKQTSPQDPSYLRFLSMFCRSVGASEGHFLRRSGRSLTSIISFGLGKEFDREFNNSHTSGTPLCPQDEACERKEVVAVVELQKDPSMPPWFMDLMNKYHLKSMVAVPLLGQAGVVGILCAYYKDICLFDQNTLDHLMMIGRMVGAATEKSAEAGRAESLGLRDKMVDKYLDALNSANLSSVQMFQMLVQYVAKTVDMDVVVSGPVRKTSDGISITLAAATGLPSSVLAERYDLPEFLVDHLSEPQKADMSPVAQKAWDDMAPLIKRPLVKPICFPLIHKKKMIGALVGWRQDTASISSDDALLLSRLTKITALAFSDK
jgi:GAF domain-containing protein